MSTSCPSCGYLLPDSYWDAYLGGGDLSASQTSASCPQCGSELPSAVLGPTIVQPMMSEADEAGRRVSHFVLQSRLGAGGFGEVWMAYDESLGRKVALKLPRSQGREMGSLLHEARTAASLKHPNIVAVHEVGTEAGQVYIASEYIEGTTLRAEMSKQRVSVEETLRLLIPVAQALHHAHENGVVHRDVKPANILLNEERRPFITDFGIAKRISEDDTKSFDGQVVGTAKYMSPEQAGGKTSQTDRRSDIYSLGVLLFEMLTGEIPFRGNMRAIVNQKLADDPPAPRTLNPKLPRDLDTICLKCLEREPARRYQSAREVCEELERVRDGLPIHARPVSKPERLWRWCKRRPLVASLLVGLFLSLSTGLTGVTFFWRRAEDVAADLRQSLYRSRMSLIGVHLDNGDVAGVQSLLKSVEEDPSLDGLRGFGFGYYEKLVEPLRLIANHGASVTDVASTRDGDLCASIGGDRRIRVWDAASGEEVRTLTVDVGLFQCIAFSPRSGRLASGSNDGFVRLWDPRQSARLLQQEKHGPSIARIRFSPTGRYLLTLGDKGPVRVWEPETLKLVAELPAGMGGSGKDVRFAGDDLHVVLAVEDGQLRYFELLPPSEGATPQTPKKAWRLVKAFGALTNLETIAVSDDGRVVAAGSYNGRLAFWSLPEGELVLEKATLWGRIDDVEFLKGSRIAAFVSTNGQTQFVRVDTGEEVASVNTHGFQAGVMARAENGRSLFCGNRDGTLMQVQLDKLTMPELLWHTAPIRTLAMLPDGKRLIASDFDGDSRKGGLRLWDLRDGAWKSLDDESEAAANELSLNPQGTLLATGGIGEFVLIRDLERMQVAARIAVPETGITAIAFSSLGKSLALAPRMGPLLVYEAGRWEQPRGTIEPHETKVNALAFSPRDEWLAVAWDDGHVGLFDAATLKPAAHRTKLNSAATALRFCDRGRLLALGDSMGEIHLWELESGRFRRIKGHTAGVNAIAVLPDGRTLVTGGRDRNLKLWDTQSGELIATLIGHHRQVFAVEVSRDGQTIASGGLEGEIRLWRSNPP